MKMPSNRLLTTTLAASLMTAGALAAMKPAQAAFIAGSQLQLNSSLFFYNGIGPTATQNQLNALFSTTGITGGVDPYAPVGSNAGTALLLASSTGSFAPYVPTPPSTLNILSVSLPTLTPAVVGNTRVFVGPGSPNAPVSNFTGGAPFLRLNNPSVAGSPVFFYFDTITEFTDNALSSNPTKTFNIGGDGRFVDSLGNALGAAQINGTFTILNNVLVDKSNGNRCFSASPNNSGNCVAGNTASFGGTFVVVAPDIPEPSSLSSILVLGALGGGSMLLKRKKSV